MIFKKETMAWNWPGWGASNRQALDLYNYLHQYDSRFTLDGNNTSVDFNGIFKIKILSDYSTYRPHWGIQCSDVSQTVYDTQPNPTSRQYWFENGCKPLKVIFLDTDDFIYLIAWPNDSDISANCIGFVYIKTSDGKHYAQTLNPGTPNIDERPYYNVVTGANVTFTLSPFIHFSVPIEEIYTADNCILLAPSTNEISIVPNFISCSTVSTDKILTLNGKNYYSAGAHTLVPLEENS